MATQNLKTDHWAKMRMNMIKSAINTEQRGRVVTWEKHHQGAAQYELEAAIRGARSVPQYRTGRVHNFQDVLRLELNSYLPGTAYFLKRGDPNFKIPQGYPNKMIRYRHPSMTSSRYTLMTLPTDPQSDQTRSRVPVLQCRGKI
ncbi:unnamed protein product [Adineta steineri]|uniref:Uncharacterized protein n=1 Tax=Adineta steineri TaxID=433720 RepID=A0A818UEN9_9BILA|nr:unnamed protein product [Adineta steineri]CAF0888257.1 unnamed protein product [Adineta steineri]CAF3696092.1 unnamed protein product [Adineta steineri]CAF3732637.1 unnamed protein product [Adineta steineri]